MHRADAEVTNLTFSYDVHLDSALPLNRRFFGDQHFAVWTPRRLAQHEFKRAVLVQDVGQDAVERNLRFFRPTLFATSYLTLGFPNGIDANCDEFSIGSNPKSPAPSKALSNDHSSSRSL